MFGKRITLFKLLGFEVKVDLSWLILAFLIIWSLARGLFPYYYPGLNPGTYWWMGVAGAIGLFLSIIIHELFHSLLARRFGLPMKGITLFIFGGVAEMDEEPSSPKAEFYMSVAGPVTSVVLSGIFYLAYLWSSGMEFPQSVTGILSYLSWINIVLAIFNMIPAFPLDGGRVLRSAIWYFKGNLQQATRIASGVGNVFGWMLIILGAVSILTGNFIGGMWWILIGIFLKGASQMSYQSTMIRNALEGESIERFMNRSPVTVSGDTTIESLVNDYVYKYQYKMFPVLDGGKELLGCITTDKIKEVPKNEWRNRKTKDLALTCSADTVVSPHTDAMKTLSIMNKSKNSRLLVVDNNNELKGVVTLKDMLEFLNLKLDLEGMNSRDVGRFMRQ